ncbi:AT hook motif DNA-binding family protein [Actinidia rufa]|uniref:AT-hook motif nuclear-localized protein n=1 Tax=Actinidia rufa TaxID=165716 RepID=A0A7J0GUR4_9ERIC|nr:AT hook motif DNA-binding family protein [Actinidia rufa]
MIGSADLNYNRLQARAQKGQFDILSLSGSYICTALGGRTGGLSVCLSSTNGQIIGGGIGGPLKAAGPVQVMLLSPSCHHQLVGHQFLVFDFRSGVDSSARIPVRGSEDPHSGSQFVIQPRGGAGMAGHGAHKSSENGAYEQLQAMHCQEYILIAALVTEHFFLLCEADNCYDMHHGFSNYWPYRTSGLL